MMVVERAPFRLRAYFNRPSAPGSWIAQTRLAGQPVGIHCKLGPIAFGFISRAWVITSEAAA